MSMQRRRANSATYVVFNPCVPVCQQAGLREGFIFSHTLSHHPQMFSALVYSEFFPVPPS